MVGLVIARARHTAKIRAKIWCFTRYLALKACDKLKTVCPRTERLSVPVIYFHITPWFRGELVYEGFCTYFLLVKNARKKKKKDENLYSVEGRRRMLLNKLSFGRIETRAQGCSPEPVRCNR
jgi:hypothetical protein